MSLRLLQYKEMIGLQNQLLNKVKPTFKVCPREISLILKLKNKPGLIKVLRSDHAISLRPLSASLIFL